MARRTRDYRRAYADPDAASGGSYEMVERLRRTFKTHRSSLEFDFHFIRDA